MKILKRIIVFIFAINLHKTLAQVPSVAAAQREKQTRQLADDFMYKLMELEKKGLYVSQKNDSQKLIEYFNTQGDIRARRDQLYSTDYSAPIVFKSLPGESDRITLLKAIPPPKMPLPAFNGDPRENERYGEQIRTAQKQAQETARQTANETELARTYKQGGDAAVKKMYQQDADKNAMLQQMGGAGAVEKMSESQRKQAASQAVMKKTGGYSPEEIRKMTPAERQALAMQMAGNSKMGQSDEAAQAFTKELMVNTDYRRRYEAMNNEEKQVEYRKFQERYYGGKVPESAQKTVNREPSSDQQEAAELKRIHDFGKQIQQEAENAMAPINEMSKRYEQAWQQDQAAVQKWVKEKMDALPTVRDSEYGARKEGAERVAFAQQALDFWIGQDYIAKQRQVWARYVDAYVNIFKKVDDFVAAYNNKPLSDRMKLALAEAQAGGYETILEMNRRAGQITNEAGSIQYSYNCLVLKNCFDPRQGK